ncbi:MAG: hypothetical protein ABEI57_05035 [Halapricum sp.]
MPGIPSLGGGADTFDDQDTYVPEHLPEPGSFLDGHDVLTGDDHVAVHRMAREVFEARGVYDVTFGYNLAKLNRDTRHPDAGFRYARDNDDPMTLLAEFTPTTEFCPQGDSLAVGAFRAFNAESDAHEFDLVSVRVDEMLQEAPLVNQRLQAMESHYVETGEIRGDIGASRDEDGEVPTERGTETPF